MLGVSNNSEENAVQGTDILCGSCNRVKGNLTKEEFSQLIMLIRNWPPIARHQTVARLKSGAQFLR